MTSLAHLSTADRLNFLLTNRIPRKALTLFMGRFSKVEFPPVRWFSMKIWQWFADDLRLFEAKQTHFNCLHDCFIRELKPGARSVDPDPDILTSPCDAQVGAFGQVDDGEVFQAKGFPYTLDDLFADPTHARRYEGAKYVTLRLKSSMYHRFHAPSDARTDTIRYVSGDTWNVNPIALSVIERLFCKNERAVIELEVDQGHVTLVAVAAVLVASMRFAGIERPVDLKYQGPNDIAFSRRFEKGDEIGYFEHGSTIVMFVNGDYEFTERVQSGITFRMGQPLFRRVTDAVQKPYRFPLDPTQTN